MLYVGKVRVTRSSVANILELANDSKMFSTP